jgi:hypothetical protein
MAKVVDESKLRSRVRNAYIALYIIGGLTLVLGLTAELGRVGVLLQLFGSGWAVAVEGLILIVLGYFTMRGSLIALGIAVALYGVDAILSLVAGGLSTVWIRALVLFFLIQGFLALQELKRRGSVAAGPQASPAMPGPADASLPPERPSTSSAHIDKQV